MDIIIEKKEKFEKALQHFKSELLGIRTGRAHPAIVENIDVLVEAYGGAVSKLRQLANISILDARTILIEPWDVSCLRSIEKAIQLSPLGFNPLADGKVLRIVIPLPTEENRKEFLRILQKKAEQVRIAVRSVRDDLKEEIIAQEKAGEISEDEKYLALKKLDEMVSGYNTQIKTMTEEKGEEIIRV